MTALQRRIRAARAFADLTQAELAAKIELSEPTYKRTELGERDVPRRELLAIAEACEVPMWFLEEGWDGGRRSVDQDAQVALSDLDSVSDQTASG